MPVIIDENKKTNNPSKHIIKDNDAEIEGATIRNDVLLEISTFLARRWSNINDVTVIISRGRKTSANMEKKENNSARIRIFLWQYISKISTMENVTMV